MRGGRQAVRRRIGFKMGQYLSDYVAGKIDLKPSSHAALSEAIELYWKPAIGHLRQVDVRDRHITEPFAP